MRLPTLKVTPKSGKEEFTAGTNDLGFTLNEFWSWNQSNLIENRTRGILAEFIVKQALDIRLEHRIEWDNFDLISTTGKRIEIKSAAYIQSWEQRAYSKISFAIEETTGAKDHPEYDGKKRRWSDYYIFCLLTSKDQGTVNPMDLDQWVFFIAPTQVLNEKVPYQTSISLNVLKSLGVMKCHYRNLKEVIDGDSDNMV